ncbi:hypothetical protein BCR39DRAFT_543951 [Naematelia encephala]|uniref:Uncharacterized protein n=1 Tax=Naematelia encephala TaxID=71784 RepID=A0A1Y2ASJ7_9TREE|nr:hypothetical protein BCR39DRAFT_543951 [Naematelia encephala]
MSTRSEYLDSLRLGSVHLAQFDESMRLLDNQSSLPLLWGSVKLSSWYTVGLLSRQRPLDVELANKLLHNGLTQQNLDPEFDRNYGSFKEFMHQPDASGNKALWAAKIYESYDPNNALFFTLACIIIISDFSHLIEPDLLLQIKQAIHRCCKGNALREGGRYGDDMWPSYSNPWFMRCVCCAFVGNLVGDDGLVRQANDWATTAIALWEKYDTPGEFNSPTYAGITMMALGLAKYCPKETVISQAAPRLIESLWNSLGETYNPTLLNIAGPWDRSYGFCMTQYFACIATPLTAASGLRCYPYPLDGSSHYSDAAIVPMQTVVSSYVESFLQPATRDKFTTLTPHSHTALSYFPPHDRRPRRYNFWLEDGLNAGGVDFDEEKLGGPKGEQKQFVPGVIQWDAGKHGGGCGWITVWPSTSCASIVASSDSLTISYPKSLDFPSSAIESNEMELHISALPFLQLDGDSFGSDSHSLPGLDVELSGNVVQQGSRTLEFNHDTQCWGRWFYRLKYTFPDSLRENGSVPTMIVHWKRTTPPVYPFQM